MAATTAAVRRPRVPAAVSNFQSEAKADDDDDAPWAWAVKGKRKKTTKKEEIVLLCLRFLSRDTGVVTLQQLILAKKSLLRLKSIDGIK